MAMIKKTVDIPIFCGQLTVVYDKDLSWVQKKFKTPSLQNYGAVTIKDESKYRHYVVAFETNGGSIIAHEIVHIINYIFLDCGVLLDRDNDETQAYLTGWLFEQIEKFIKQ